MNNKHQVHNLIILDESGSMGTIKKTIIQGFNEIVQTVRGIEEKFPEQEHFISVVSFNGLGHKLLHFIDPANKLQQIDESRYQPNASTPLYDAMGYSLNKLRQVLENQKDYNVLVTILTDGAENASREFSGAAIKNLVEEFKRNSWTFTYIGADHDVDSFAASLSINNTMTFQKNDANMKEMFDKEKYARIKYAEKLRRKEELSNNFYEPEEPKK